MFELSITRVHPALLAGSTPALASCSQRAAGGGRWLLMAARGHLGGHAAVVLGQDLDRGGAVERPPAQAGHIPRWRGSGECYALSPIAAGSRWLLLLLLPSPLLSATGPVPVSVVFRLMAARRRGPP